MKLLKYLDDLLVFIGCALILIGVVVLCPVAGWFAAGGMFVFWGIMVGRNGARS
jgi:hypothetical protein